MKVKILGVLAAAFAALIMFRSFTAQASSLERWDLTKEYTIESNSVRYHAYLTKDKKESWIYKAELLDTKKVLNIQFPKRIEGVPVTCLGETNEYFGTRDLSKDDSYHNIFDKYIEPWHDYDERPSSEVMNVRTIVIPDSVDEVGLAAFACIGSLQYIHLPQNLTSLSSYMFYGCYNLERIEFPPKVKTPDSSVFLFCDGLKGLMEEVEFRREGMTILCQGDLLINESEKTLIQVMPAAKSITIPANVKGIEPAAFTNSSLQKIKVAKKNRYFAVHKRCLYNKKNGKLVLAFGKGETLRLSKKVKKIGKDTMITKYKLKKVVISRKIKRASGWKKPLIANNKKIKIYYRGKRIR